MHEPPVSVSVERFGHLVHAANGDRLRSGHAYEAMRDRIRAHQLEHVLGLVVRIVHDVACDLFPQGLRVAKGPRVGELVEHPQ